MVVAEVCSSMKYPKRWPSVPMMMRHLAWQKLDSKEGEKVA